MGLAGTLWRSITAIDRTKLRRWSAVRRGAVVLVAFGVGGAVGGWDLGALASVSALFVGLQERNAAASYTSRIMVVQSVFYGGLVLVAGSLSRVHLVPVLILTLVAAASGLTAYNDKAMSRMFGDAMPVAAFLSVSATDPHQAPPMALAVLLGGLGQALGAVVTARVESDLMERRSVAAALAAVAEHLDDSLPLRRKTTGRTAEERLSAAADFLLSTDLKGPRLRELRKLLTTGEVLRQEAAAIRIRRSMGVMIGDETQLAVAVNRAAHTLRAIAAGLTRVMVTSNVEGWGPAAVEAVARTCAAAATVESDRSADPTARAISRDTVRLCRHLELLIRANPVRGRRKRRRVAQGLRRQLLQPNQRDLTVGIRLAVATLIAFGTALLIHLPHGAWVASTTVSLLRPDWRPLTADAIGRVIATSAASALAIPLILLTGDTAGFDSALLLVMAVAVYVIAAANEGLYVMATSLVTVFTLAVVGENPVAAAAVRVKDVLVGALIAVIFLLLIPVGQGRRLARDLASYATETAAWLDALALLFAGEDPPGEKELRAAMRAARVRVQQGVDVRVAEPTGPGLAAQRATIVFEWVHDAARSAAAAERAVKHGSRATPESSELARDAALSLRYLAGQLHRRQVDRLRPLTHADNPIDDVEVLMRHSAQCARQAVAALIAVEGGRRH